MSIPTDMPMSVERVEVITGAGPRRRFSVDEKLQLIEETQQPGMSVSLVARQHGIAPNQLVHLATALCERCPVGSGGW